MSVTHQDYSGFFPFHILKDDLTKPGFLPFKSDPRHMVPWWWKMTKVRAQGKITFGSNLTDSLGNLYVVAAEKEFDGTYAVVPDGCHQGSDRSAPQARMIDYDSGRYWLGFTDVDTTWTTGTQTITSHVDGSTTETTLDHSLLLISLDLLFPPGEVVAPFSHGPAPHFPASAVVVSPAGDYYPSFLFTIRGLLGHGGGYLSMGGETYATSWNNTPAQTNSGGDPGVLPFVGGFTIADIGSGKFADQDGIESDFRLYAYNGAYVDASFSPTGFSGTVTTKVVDLILTPIFT